MAISLFVIALFALIFYIISPKAFSSLESLLKRWEEELKTRSFTEVLMGSIGLVIGLIIAFLISQPLLAIPIPYVGAALSAILYGMFGYLGVKIAIKNREDISGKFREIVAGKGQVTKEKLKPIKSPGVAKVLDTSVIIDGRIKEICASGFLEGPLILPIFVLEELQHIADSSDALKRNRGRRGLDIIKEMQDDNDTEVILYDAKYDSIKEVDSKLLALTKDLNGKIVTNDYNLNKVAKVQNISVLNINELANSVKPVYLPGEEMKVDIVKQGKEHNQGLGYLDDGTMIVVEQGKNYLGQTVDVTVTSVLQTSAGKMIFARLN
ncbi:PIN/TRAM domain-containing protein [Peptoniphilus catoniae]|uniref:PIN/TRAM domain-containing protein n=1 Tax=Peptoniphilus catoniae TaxID=1660341 RepID=UPI001FE97EB2